MLYLPGLLFWRRRAERARRVAAARFAFIALGSPAALLAIGSGTALLFAADALHGWMFVKLALVGVLVGAHILFGTALFKLAERLPAPGGPWLLGAALAVAAAIVVILYLVLGEPPLSAAWLPDWVLEPGGLGRQFSSPMPI